MGEVGQHDESDDTEAGSGGGGAKRNSPKSGDRGVGNNTDGVIGSGGEGLGNRQNG
jgi:hypothetical protein